MVEKAQHRFCFWTVLMFTLGWTAVAGADGKERGTVALGADGRAFTFSVPGVMEFKGSFSATIVSGMQTRELLSTLWQAALPAGQTQELHSATGTLLGPIEESSEETPCGRAEVTEVTLRFGKEHIDLLFRISQVPGVRGFQTQAGIRNTGSSPVRLLSLTPVALEGRVEGKPAEWLVTALDQSVAKFGPAVVALDELQAPFEVHEYGGFYRGDGKGFLFGPVGSPTAYLKASIAHKGDGKMAFAVVADMSGVLVKPGETRWGQQAGFFAEPPRTALPRWAEWVAKTHGARTDKHALSGWNNWEVLDQDITGKNVLAEVDVVVKNPERLRPQVMQIDVGYETDTDSRGSLPNFPEGTAFYAQRMAVTGARPGILLEFTGSQGWSNMVKRVRAAVADGYTYLKINRKHLVLLPEELVANTSFEVMRKGFAYLRKTAGEGTYLLYNDIHPERATLGLVDANRTGDNSDRRFLRYAMTDVLRSYPLNGRWFAVDNDSYYMGTDIANVSEIAGGWPLVRTWMSMVGLSCGAAITADPWSRESFRPYWRNVEVMTPSARERTEVLDLCTSREWPRLVCHVTRDWGDMTVALLWNPGAKERTVILDFAEAGLHPDHRYAVWSFWDNRYMGIAKGSWKTLSLAASASQHLCFTDLDRTPNKPVLIGSSLHIYCGAAEIKRVKQGRGSMEIELTDAGAREGDLFIYSRRQPVRKAAEGCEVSEIASAGENVWRINLVNRKCGAPQRVALGILLPVTRQIWFWALCGVAAASLLFAAWRYVAVQRLQRQNALAEERSRIARDLHDEIGAKLTRLSLLGAMVDEDAQDASPLHREVTEMAEAARAIHRAFDEIVWSVNPRNDTVSSLSHYICRYAEEFFDGSPVSCHCRLPENLSGQALPPQRRHQLFLAVKEGLNNVLKHAAATRVDVVIHLAASRLCVQLSDNGHGFDPAQTGAHGDGLRNMQERMRATGGKLSLDSRPGAGTRLTFEIPLISDGVIPRGDERRKGQEP
jgi:signal transduction histidine kinase